jgi:hypothetical protein
MEAAGTSKILVPIYQTWHHVPEKCHLNTHRPEHFISQAFNINLPSIPVLSMQNNPEYFSCFACFLPVLQMQPIININLTALTRVLNTRKVK